MAKDILSRLMRRYVKLEKLSREIDDATQEIASLRNRIEYMKAELEDAIGPLRHVVIEREKTSEDGWKLLERVTLPAIINALEEGGD